MVQTYGVSVILSAKDSKHAIGLHAFDPGEKYADRPISALISKNLPLGRLCSAWSCLLCTIYGQYGNHSGRNEIDVLIPLRVATYENAYKEEENVL